MNKVDRLFNAERKIMYMRITVRHTLSSIVQHSTEYHLYTFHTVQCCVLYIETDQPGNPPAIVTLYSTAVSTVPVFRPTAERSVSVPKYFLHDIERINRTAQSYSPLSPVPWFLPSASFILDVYSANGHAGHLDPLRQLNGYASSRAEPLARAPNNVFVFRGHQKEVLGWRNVFELPMQYDVELCPGLLSPHSPTLSHRFRPKDGPLRRFVVIGESMVAMNCSHTSGSASDILHPPCCATLCLYITQSVSHLDELKFHVKRAYRICWRGMVRDACFLASKSTSA